MTALSFICPRCRGEVTIGADHYRCASCNREYPVIEGIPDFRICRDAYLSIAEDRAKAKRIATGGPGTATFMGMLHDYYAITPEVPAADAERYSRYHLEGVERGRNVLERFAAYGLNDGTVGNRMIDVGCGTAGTVIAAARAGYEVVGADIALRWLVVARRRLAEEDRSASLVCACADHLPFADGSFDAVVAENLLEHTNDHAAVLSELSRIRRQSGRTMVRTVNRLALAREPHVGLWGVGLLPRSIAARYVRRRTGALYAVRLPTYFSLRRTVSLIAPDALTVRRALLMDRDFQSRSGVEALLARLYAWLDARAPFSWPFLTLFGPFLDVVTPRPSAKGTGAR